MDYKEYAEQVIMKTYHRFPIVFDHGEGVYLFDIEHKNTWILDQELQYVLLVITIKNTIMR